jgi:predicted N-formylglutamate amidohydrolase
VAVADAPHLVLNGRSLVPLILTCEHASRRLPPGVRATGAARALMATHRASDLGAGEIARALARRLRATLVAAGWSRLWVDLNRPVGDPELILPEAGGVELGWNRRPGPGEIERRVTSCHAPYHAEIDRQTVRRLLRGLRPLLVSVHTFTPRLGRSRRSFDVGLLYVDHGPLAWRLGKRLRGDGLTLRYNQPYSGPEGLMYAIHRHGSHHRLPCVEIEVSQALATQPSPRRRVVAALASALEAELAPPAR